MPLKHLYLWRCLLGVLLVSTFLARGHISSDRCVDVDDMLNQSHIFFGFVVNP
eukprot:c46630_g1_i1 orf=2-157(-)